MPPKPSQQLTEDPYTGLAVVGIGMTGIVLKINEYRVVKVAKTYPLDHLSEPDRSNAISMMKYLAP